MTWPSDWTDRKRLGELLKIVFIKQLINPNDYDKEHIIALKQSISQFSAVDDDLFFTAFRRSSSEYLLSKDLDAVESRCTIHQGPRANQASAPAPLATKKESTPAPPQIVSSHRKQASKPNTTMPSSSFHVCLPHVVSNWIDEKQNGRVHVVIGMPSGTHLLKHTEIISTDSGPCLSVIWEWPQIMLDPTKVFSHSRFKRTIQASHPKVIAFVGETDKIRAAADKIADGLCTSKMIVKLPPGEYQYTPVDISGHPSVNLFSSESNTGGTFTTIFCLFDLMVKVSDDGKRFSTKASLVDDDECD